MAEMSLDSIRITASSCKVDFAQARRLAEQVIRGMVRAPRLIAWLDTKKQSYAQEVAGVDTQLKSNGGIRVDINGEEYSFIFTESDK